MNRILKLEPSKLQRYYILAFYELQKENKRSYWMLSSLVEFKVKKITFSDMEKGIDRRMVKEKEIFKIF